MSIDARTRAWLRLHLIDGIGPRRLHALLSALGSPEAVLDASSATLAGVVGPALAEAIRRGPDTTALARSEAWLEADGHALIAWDDADYPPQLLAIADPPPALFFLGRRALLTRPAIAVVGSRNATDQGLETAEAFARALGEAGLTVISGLALGIDSAAHRGGLRTAAASIAVVATGLDRIYPAANKALAHELADRGAIVSEFAAGAPPVASHFPRRNRLISGMARGVLVVEATVDSGSLITARLAAEQGREVFAIPGSIHSPLARGCHRLIRDGAKLVETVDDVLSELNWTTGPGPISVTAPDVGQPLDKPASAPASMSTAADDAGKILAALGFDPAPADVLSARTGLSAARVQAALVTLELAGRVRAEGSGRFRRRTGPPG